MTSPLSRDSERTGDNPLITFDLFSALVDSRTGGSRAFGRLADRRGWNVTGSDVYDAWDRRSKQSHRDHEGWISFAEHAQSALAQTYVDLGLNGDAAVDATWILGTVGRWPLWPDVSDGLPSLARTYDIGILSNVDDDVFRRTRAARLVRDAKVFSSERLGAYKPSPEIYHRTKLAAGGQVIHVASSARDVRGALEAGITVIRLRRPGHELDPAGPSPAWQAGDLGEVATILTDLVHARS